MSGADNREHGIERGLSLSEACPAEAQLYRRSGWQAQAMPQSTPHRRHTMHNDSQTIGDRVIVNPRLRAVRSRASPISATIRREAAGTTSSPTYGGLASAPSERFDTREQAEAARRCGEGREVNRMEVICRQRARAVGGKGEGHGPPGSGPAAFPARRPEAQDGDGNLYVTVSTDEEGSPSRRTSAKPVRSRRGVTELACIDLPAQLRRGTPVEEIIEQIRGGNAAGNLLPDVTSRGSWAWRRHSPGILKGFVRPGEEVESAEAKAAA